MFNHADLFLNKYKRPVVYPAKIHAARKRPDGDDVVTLRKRPKADQFALGIIQSQVQGRMSRAFALAVSREVLIRSGSLKTRNSGN